MQFSTHFNRFSLLALPLALSLCTVSASAQETEPEPEPEPTATPKPTPPPLPQISIKDAKVKEGNSGESTLEFQVGLNKISNRSVTVVYRTFGRTASGTTDFINTRGTLTFSPGVKTKVVTVKVKGDTLAEQNETLFVKLTGPKYAALRDDEGIGTIINDDGAPKAPAGSGKIAYASQDWNSPGIYIMNSDGTNRTRVTTEYNDTDPVWSPDGNKIAFKGFFFADGTYTYGVGVVDANGKNRRFVSTDTGYRAEWSPDSKALYYFNYGAQTGLVKVDIADGTTTKLTANGYDTFPSASLKAKKIALVSWDTTSTYRWQIYTVNSNGGDRKQLTFDAEMDNFLPQISDDGKVIIFVKQDTQSIQLYAMNGDGGNQRLLVEFFSGSNPAVILSADGKKAAFSINDSGSTTVYTIDVAKGTVKVIANGQNPTLSPDGARLAFETTRDGNTEIYSANLDGAKQTRLTNNTMEDIKPDFAAGSVPAPKSSSASSSTSGSTATKTSPSSNSS